ncbi:hypothetical protein K474DRAFT_1667178 [Panus rudis PR-1116 ss-1]|nr:hypothetical protein K474DRAFT_1667178 [Panus rudis PR-1116 ss-1]
MRVNLAAVESAEAGTTGDSTNDGGVVGGRENGGGAKHWTDEEKGKLFVWMLASDEHWGAFANQMNSVFREAASVLFEGKKSFTALKSCYHRNVETFKQIYAFNKFLCTSLPSNPGDLAGPMNTNSATSGDPSSTASGSNAQDILHAPIPASFSSPIHRQTFLERKLEAGRSVANIPVANLNIKVVDHWYKLGWFELFRRRYRPDVTGNILPYHGPDPPPPDPLAHIFPPPPPHIIAAFQGNMQSISGQELVANGNQSGEEEEEGGSGEDELEEGEGGNKDSPNRPSSSRNRASSQGSRAVQPPTHPQAPYSMNGHMQPAQPPPMGYPYPYPPPDNGAHYYAAYKPSPYAPPLPPQPPSPHMQQTLGHLTSLTQTLITSCNTLTELLRTQVEEGKAWKDLLKKAEEREARRDQQSVTSGDLLLDKKEKASLAAEVLAKQGVDEEVRQAAAAYLKRLFDGG